MQFVPCPSCARHVKSSEAACPFCSATLSGLTISRAPAVRRRLERLAAFTFAATIAVTGCAVSGEEDSESSEQDIGAVHPMYGMPPAPHDAGPAHTDAAPPVTDAGPPCTPVDDELDPAGFHAMYGAPPFHPNPCPVDPPATDAGPPHPAVDAGPAPFDAGGFHAMYGMPPGH
jgi:hypothetical protein